MHGRSQDAGGAAVSSEAGLGRGPPPTGRFSARGPSGLPGRGLGAWLRLHVLGPSPNGSSQRTACFSHACQRESPSKTDARIGPGGDVTAVATRRWLEASRGPIHSRGAGQMRCEPRRQGPRELSATVAGPSVRGFQVTADGYGCDRTTGPGPRPRSLSSVLTAIQRAQPWHDPHSTAEKAKLERPGSSPKATQHASRPHRQVCFTPEGQGQAATRAWAPGDSPVPPAPSSSWASRRRPRPDAAPPPSSPERSPPSGPRRAPADSASPVSSA